MVAYLVDGQAILVIIRPALLIFIDEIAIMIDEGEIILLRQVTEGGEIPILVILASSNAEFQARGASRRQRQRPRAAAHRPVAPQREAIPIGPVGLKPGDFDMDAVAQFRPRS